MQLAFGIQTYAARCLAIALVFSLSSQLFAQEKKPAAAPIGSKHIPDDALALLTFSPAELMAAANLELFPIEIFRAEALDRVGIDPMDISNVSILVGMPGPNGPIGGAVIETSKDVSIAKLLEALRVDSDPIDIDGREAYLIPETPGALLHQVDSNTIVVSIGDWLDQLVTSENGTGQLATLAASLPRPKGITLISAIKPIRPILTGVVQQQAEQLPEPMRPLTELPELVDALLVNLNPTGVGIAMRLTMLCADEAGATDVEKILVDSITFGKEMGIAQAKEAAESSPQSEAVKEATLKYIDRMAEKLSTNFTPVRSGRRVSMMIQGDTGIATTGIMAGLLLPAIQASREAARRMSAGNNLKQIGLAIHNYHAAYNRMPPAAIVDEDGKPLLSWRVAILPFVEQQALYEKFHLDEPWDSPHNKPLSEILPSVYIDPSAPLEPGQTVFQAAVGDEFIFETDEEVGFRNVTDGTSNTIMVMEVGRENAVIWSKPDDIAIDLDDPLAGLGNAHLGGFHVLMSDGAVRFIANSIDVETFKALLTRAGGEAVNFP
jgi:hypothetical protein